MTSIVAFLLNSETYNLFWIFILQQQQQVQLQTQQKGLCGSWHTPLIHQR